MTGLAASPSSTGIVDQSVCEMNTKLSEVVDKALGFGFLEGQVKGQLVKLRNPVPFCSYLSTDSSFDSAESTSLSRDCARLNLMVQLTTPEGDYGAESSYFSRSQTCRDQRVVCFFFKRVIAKRSIPVPKFTDLIPVRKKSHAEDGQWIVERLGNQVCTDEFYGGVANVSFVWDHSASMNASKLISSVQAALASGDVKKELVQACETNQINCRATVKGFALPDPTKGPLTSTYGVVNLIELLNYLPIVCAVPVETKSVPIQNARNFPYSIRVETQIRDLKTQEKLTELLLRIHGNGGRDSALCEFVERLSEEIEDAAFNGRALVPHLKKLANIVVQTLVHHGKCVELYERYGDFRLRTQNCSTNGVTASATETLFGFTFGVAIPFVRLYQWGVFERSEKWTRPKHYGATKIAYTQTVSGYYDRVKLQLLFDNKELLREWQTEMDRIVASRRPRSGAGPWGTLIDAFAA
ncbi:hypothetical protein PHYSODRAFT_307299 [Phytophthora sojae]|uniref:Uncharacterized protein n=1 Tax=Phytophthora sojae (strain P6497) TaxID=1094619 RepID=G5ADR9_PHYSP|nr:hypothetical protein PHYSODRAFT_307299 [Phytophthora sojae]EGZ06322.1 hypothetical protein PHYSODRAFT_307299 [Phytophthora sojae]|eukprot:XP_009538219.1 hypothetical protein PHYSODRAFT_307299 [Phytophthora sojae]